MDLLRMHAEMVADHLVKLYDDLPQWGKIAVAAGGLAAAVYVPYSYLQPPRRSPIKEDYKKDIVYLYQFPRIKNIPNLSPYCLKLETWLRMADFNYENVPCGWLTRSKEGTVPFIELNGQEYPDSSLIIDELSQKFRKEENENHLDDEQRAASRAFMKMTEHSLYETIALLRYSEHADEIFKQIPREELGIFGSVRLLCMKRSFVKRVCNRVKVAGIGKHSREDVIKIANGDLKAISEYLGSKEYFTGIKPTYVDASLFGVLAQIVYAPYELPQKKAIQENYKNLLDYCERIKGRFWPDWEECTTKFSMDSKWKSSITAP